MLRTSHNSTTLVLVLFERDRTVVPKESAWFGSYRAAAAEEEDGEREGKEKTLVPMREQPLYKEDWIGLRALDEHGRVVLASVRGGAHASLHRVLAATCGEVCWLAAALGTTHRFSYLTLCKTETAAPYVCICVPLFSLFTCHIASYIIFYS